MPSLAHSDGLAEIGTPWGARTPGMTLAINLAINRDTTRRNVFSISG
jgi:hypothetical protein